MRENLWRNEALITRGFVIRWKGVLLSLLLLSLSSLSLSLSLSTVFDNSVTTSLEPFSFWKPGQGFSLAFLKALIKTTHFSNLTKPKFQRRLSIFGQRYPTGFNKLNGSAPVFRLSYIRLLNDFLTAGPIASRVSRKPPGDLASLVHETQVVRHFATGRESNPQAIAIAMEPA